MTEISIVIPARNVAPTLEETLHSVLSAAEVDEVLIVDDGSTDGTADVARAMGDPRLRVLQGPCRGISAALNTGFRAASGIYVARCDGDDLFVRDRLARQRDWLAAHPDFVGMSGAFETMDDRGRALATLSGDAPARDVTEEIAVSGPLTHFGTWLIRRAALIEVDGAREWFETAEDVDLQIRLAAFGRVWHDPQVTYRYRLHDKSITHSRKAAQVAFFDRMARQFGQQRHATGTDDLARGAPPALPDFAGDPGVPNAARRQAVGHMTAQAWRDFSAGRRGAAITGLSKAVRRAPSDSQTWKQLAVLLAKTLRPGRR